ncbi:MAG: hypothetical protein ACW964_07260 [Candidatus Hodarchaeales archaeon]
MSQKLILRSIIESFIGITILIILLVATSDLMFGEGILTFVLYGLMLLMIPIICFLDIVFGNSKLSYFLFGSIILNILIIGTYDILFKNGLLGIFFIGIGLLLGGTLSQSQRKLRVQTNNEIAFVREHSRPKRF